MADQLGMGPNATGGIHQWKAQDVDGGRENMPAAIPATDPTDDPIGTVRIEQHDDGHSVWQHTGGTPGNEWMCVWSDRGEEGCSLPPAGVAAFPVASGVPGTPAAPVVDGDLRERILLAATTACGYESWAEAESVNEGDDAGGLRAIADGVLAVVQPETERVTKLADVHRRKARFWADHFAEVERANRDALGAHHKPGHSVAELIATLVGELAEVREFGNDAMNSAHTKAQEIAKWVEGYGELSADNKRLTRERDEARAEVSRLERCYDAVKERAERAEARPAIPADAEKQLNFLLVRACNAQPLEFDPLAETRALLAVWSAPVPGSDTATPSWYGRECSGCGQHVASREPGGVGKVLCIQCHPGDLPFKASPDMTASGTEYCTAEIWPSWANSWVPCGGGFGTDGRCRYGHTRPEVPSSPGGSGVSSTDGGDRG